MGVQQKFLIWPRQLVLEWISGFSPLGKSTLFINLAGIYSDVAPCNFATLTTVLGVIRYKGAKIQLLDLPSISEGAKDRKGRDRQYVTLALTSNLILIVPKHLGH